MNRLLVVWFAVIALPLVCRADNEKPLPTFKKITLSDKFYCEGAYYADFNKDGKLDVVAGPFWYEGPDFQKKHEIHPPKAFDPKGYSDNFLTFTGDFNGDGWPDVLYVPYPGQRRLLVREPGRQGRTVEEAPGPARRGQRIAGVGRHQRRRPARNWSTTSTGYLGYATYDPAKPDDRGSSIPSRPRAPLPALHARHRRGRHQRRRPHRHRRSQRLVGAAGQARAGQALDQASLQVRRGRRADARLRRGRRRAERRDHRLALPSLRPGLVPAAAAARRAARSPGSST